MPVWVRRSRLGMVSPDSQATASCRQADTPLIVLFRFPGPALSACVLVVAFCAVMLAGCDYTGRVSTGDASLRYPTMQNASFFDIASHIGMPFDLLLFSLASEHLTRWARFNMQKH
jgi:hypothetical protein